MHSFFIEQRVEVDGLGSGTIKAIEEYPDGDLRYLIVLLDNGREFKASEWETWPL